MNLRFKISEILYFLGAVVVLISGIGFRSTAAVGMALYLLYSGRRRVFAPGESSIKPSVGFLKINLIWDLIFLAISVLILFSVLKVILNIFLHGEILIVSQWIPIVSGLGLLYFELLFRKTGDKKNRMAVLLLMILLILSAASLILDGIWLKTDPFLGFLSLTLTVIISFRKAYLELSDLLQ